MPAGDETPAGTDRPRIRRLRLVVELCREEGLFGTCIYSRVEPLSVTYGIGADEHDREGRVICFETPDFYLVNVYTPNSQDGLRRLGYRMQWEDAFREYAGGLARRKGVVICGDMNVAHEEIDLRNPCHQPPECRIHRRGERQDEPAFWGAASATAGGTSIPTRRNIPGGRTGCAPARGT